MKRILLVLGLMILVSSTAMAASRNSVVNSNNSLENYYTKMKTCTPAKASGLQVVGKVGGKCQFKEGPVTCNVPMSVAQKYATESLNQLGKNGHNKYIDDVINNPQYCQFKF